MSKKLIQSRKITYAMENRIAGNQFFKCANSPGAKLIGLKNYKCPLWQKEGHTRGSFDASGFDIDHVVEFHICRDDSEDDLQALCPYCHRFKTETFMLEF